MKRTKKSNHAHDSADMERLYRTIPPSDKKRLAAERNTPDAMAPKVGWKRRLKRVFMVLFIIVLLAVGWVGGKFVINSAKIFGWGGFLSMFSMHRLQGEKDGRVYVLLAGNSADDPGHAGANLTDSIMVLGISPKEHKGYIVSIPRDLYVDIPGNGYAKINEVYQDGEQGSSGSIVAPSEGGMDLLRQVVSRDLGINIHYYALVNYTALREAVDAVGGVDIVVDSSDERGIYDPSPDLANGRQPLVDLPNGPAHLSGLQALNLARARGHASRAYGFESGDFARAQHQRQILLALKDKASSVGTLSNPVKVGQLFDSMGNNVETNLTLGDVRRLYDITKDIKNEAIVSASLDNVNNESLLEPYTNRRGQYTLIPRSGVDDYSEIQAYIKSLETSN